MMCGYVKGNSSLKNFEFYTNYLMSIIDEMDSILKIANCFEEFKVKEQIQNKLNGDMKEAMVYFAKCTISNVEEIGNEYLRKGPKVECGFQQQDPKMWQRGNGKSCLVDTCLKRENMEELVSNGICEEPERLRRNCKCRRLSVAELKGKDL